MAEPRSLYIIVRYYIAICLTIVLLIGMPSQSSAQDDAAGWLQKIDDAERVPHSTAMLKQTITTSGGSERTFTIRAWSDENGDVSLMVYTDPPRVKGDKILQRDGGDNIWYYMQRRDVTRHFVGTARKQSAMGSDFSYEDMAAGSMTEDYSPELLGSEEIAGEKCVKLKLVPTETGPSYKYLILWASYEDHITRRIDYYDEDGLLKTLSLSQFKEIEGRVTAHRMEMKNRRESSRTVMEYESITYAEKPESWMFTKEALTR